MGQYKQELQQLREPPMIRELEIEIQRISEEIKEIHIKLEPIRKHTEAIEKSKASKSPLKTIQELHLKQKNQFIKENQPLIDKLNELEQQYEMKTKQHWQAVTDHINNSTLNTLNHVHQINQLLNKLDQHISHQQSHLPFFSPDFSQKMSNLFSSIQTAIHHFLDKLMSKKNTPQESREIELQVIQKQVQEFTHDIDQITQDKVGIKQSL